MRIHLSETFYKHAKFCTKFGLATVAFGGGSMAGAVAFCGVCDGVFGLLSGDPLTSFFNPLVQKADFILGAAIPAASAGAILYAAEQGKGPIGRP